MNSERKLFRDFNSFLLQDTQRVLKSEEEIRQE